MTDDREPKRWRDADDCDPALSRALDSARRELDPVAAAALAERIERGVSARLATGARSGPTRGRAVIARGLMTIGVAILAVAAWWMLRVETPAPARSTPARDGSQRSEVPAPAKPPVERNAAMGAAEPANDASERAPGELELAPSAQPAPAEATRAQLPDAASLTGAKAARAPRVASARPSTAPAAGTSARPASGGEAAVPSQTSIPPELQLLSEAQRALRAAPASALELAAEHARAYPSGRFAQEREEIAIEALFALGRTAQAEARARAFIARYPRSVQAARFEKRLRGGSAE